MEQPRLLVSGLRLEDVAGDARARVGGDARCVRAAAGMLNVPRMWRNGPCSAATNLNDVLTLRHMLSTTFTAFMATFGP